MFCMAIHTLPVAVRFTSEAAWRTLVPSRRVSHVYRYATCTDTQHVNMPPIDKLQRMVRIYETRLLGQFITPPWFSAQRFSTTAFLPLLIVVLFLSLRDITSIWQGNLVGV